MWNVGDMTGILKASVGVFVCACVRVCVHIYLWMAKRGEVQ